MATPESRRKTEASMSAHSGFDPWEDVPSDWVLLRERILGLFRRFRLPFLFTANALLTLAAILVYHVLQPAPQRLTQRDIDGAVVRSLDKAQPRPSDASVAYEAIRPSLVAIRTLVEGSGEPHGALGTGVVVADTGIILTCLHVVKDASRVLVQFADGSPSEALVMLRQPENDLAVLSSMRVPDDLKPATLAGAGGLRPGDEVFAVGNPFGLMNSISAGVVSGLGREYESKETGVTMRNLIQFDAAVNPGNSGGPLCNRDGEVVGIVSALLHPGGEDVFIGIGFAVTMETAGGLIGAPPI
jgi:S1-C subfamily serine protease